MFTDSESFCSFFRIIAKLTRTLPDIVTMQRNIPLRSEWEAEETYNFRDYHRPECKQKETKGKCGCEGQTEDQLINERRLRKDLARQKKRKASDSTATSEEQQDSETMTTKREELGDEEFVIKAPPRVMPPRAMPPKAMPSKARPATISLDSIAQPFCFRCTFRNIECDRQMPCGACVEGKAKCTYSPSTPIKGSPTTRTPTDGTPTKGSPTMRLQTKGAPNKGTSMNRSPSTSYFDLMDTATPSSAPSPSPPASWGQRGYATYSCMTCAARKIRCDRQTPCSTCKAQKVDCVYNPSTTPTKRAPRKKATPRKSVKFAE